MTENRLIPQDYTTPTVDPCPKCGAVHWIHEEKGHDLDRMECLECHTVIWGFSGVFTPEPALATWNALSKERQRLQAELDATKDKLAQTKWKPIETAIKDKYILLAWDGVTGDEMPHDLNVGIGKICSNSRKLWIINAWDNEKVWPSFWKPLYEPPNEIKGEQHD